VVAVAVSGRGASGRGADIVRKAKSGATGCALLFVGMLFPALGFVNVFPSRYSFVADHFQ
jgi:hypothetical protein